MELELISRKMQVDSGLYVMRAGEWLTTAGQCPKRGQGWIILILLSLALPIMDSTNQEDSSLSADLLAQTMTADHRPVYFTTSLPDQDQLPPQDVEKNPPLVVSSKGQAGHGATMVGKGMYHPDDIHSDGNDVIDLGLDDVGTGSDVENANGASVNPLMNVQELENGLRGTEKTLTIQTQNLTLAEGIDEFRRNVSGHLLTNSTVRSDSTTLRQEGFPHESLVDTLLPSRAFILIPNSTENIDTINNANISHDLDLLGRNNGRRLNSSRTDSNNTSLNLENQPIYTNNSEIINRSESNDNETLGIPSVDTKYELKDAEKVTEVNPTADFGLLHLVTSYPFLGQVKLSGTQQACVQCDSSSDGVEVTGSPSDGTSGISELVDGLRGLTLVHILLLIVAIIGAGFLILTNFVGVCCCQNYFKTHGGGPVSDVLYRPVTFSQRRHFSRISSSRERNRDSMIRRIADERLHHFVSDRGSQSEDIPTTGSKNDVKTHPQTVVNIELLEASRHQGNHWINSGGKQTSVCYS